MDANILELAKSMLSCKAMRNRGSRNALVEQLPSDIKTRIECNDIDHVHVVNIISRCMDFEGGLAKLVHILRLFEGDSIPMKQVDAVARGEADASPDYIAVLEKDARLFERNDAHTEAVKAWEQVRYFEPDHPEATQRLRRLKEKIRLKIELDDVLNGLTARMTEIIDIYGVMAKYINRMKKDGVDENGDIFLKMAGNFLESKIDGKQFVRGWEGLGSETPKSTSAPNYARLADCFKHGEIIPFFGSDVSHQEEQPFPTSAKMAEGLAEAAEYQPFPGNLPMIAQYYTMAWNRKLLIRNIKGAVPPECRESDSNPLFGMAAGTAGPIVAISATYGGKLESAFRKCGKSFAVVTHSVPLKTEHEFGKIIVQYSDRKKPERPVTSENLSKLNLLEKGYSVIYKIHGCFSLCKENPGSETDTLVISEADFYAFLKYMDKIMPSYILRQIRKQCLLFVGCRLNEWQDRLVAAAILEKRRDVPGLCHAVCPDPTPYEQAFWKYYGVELYEMETELFADRLGGAMNA